MTWSATKRPPMRANLMRSDLPMVSPHDPATLDAGRGGVALAGIHAHAEPPAPTGRLEESPQAFLLGGIDRALGPRRLTRTAADPVDQDAVRVGRTALQLFRHGDTLDVDPPILLGP